MPKSISAPDLKAQINDGEELALLDVREQGSFGRRHLFFSSCLPLSHLELRIRDLVPRHGARIVLSDAGEGLAGRAAEKLERFGYSDVAVLENGVQGWSDAGYELFSGVSVPSKAFGEFVEHVDETPNITSEQLRAKRAGGEDVIVLDSRPLDEYLSRTIPGAINVPGAELVYRVRAIVPDPTTQIVVNCAGRTRSIIGAQSLINAGVPNPVRALRNGTMGWHLAGLELERGATRLAPEPNAAELKRALTTAADVAERFSVTCIGVDTLEQWCREADSRSLYLLDVRHPEEYAGGHLRGSRHAPGGQLVQNTDSYIATRGARVVLIDDTAMRATMTASWLLQMGWRDTAVLRNGLESDDLDTGGHSPEIPGLDGIEAAQISPYALKRALDAGDTAVVDLSPSRTYKTGHIPGAWYSTRAKLTDNLPKVPEASLLVLVSEDENLAALAAPEAEAATDTPIKVLTGGTPAWRDLGYPLAVGFENMTEEPDDHYPRAYDRDTDVEQAMQDYLTWEIGLVEQVERDGDARFDIVRPH
ncbi:MAG: thiosulfate sulfurtransferase [Alphaproteobacteria bacterium]|nr:thiosulfate sulfurtransferase [Alphaproteobacteria bacterium]